MNIDKCINSYLPINIWRPTQSQQQIILSDGMPKIWNIFWLLCVCVCLLINASSVRDSLRRLSLLYLNDMCAALLRYANVYAYKLSIYMAAAAQRLKRQRQDQFWVAADDDFSVYMFVCMFIYGAKSNWFYTPHRYNIIRRRRRRRDIFGQTFCICDPDITLFWGAVAAAEPNTFNAIWLDGCALRLTQIL